MGNMLNMAVVPQEFNALQPRRLTRQWRSICKSWSGQAHEAC